MQESLLDLHPKMMLLGPCRDDVLNSDDIFKNLFMNGRYSVLDKLCFMDTKKNSHTEVDTDIYVKKTNWETNQ